MGCFVSTQELKQEKKQELEINYEPIKEHHKNEIKEDKEEHKDNIEMHGDKPVAVIEKSPEASEKPVEKVEKSVEYGGCEKLEVDLKINSGNYTKLCEVPVEAFIIHEGSKKVLEFNAICLSKEGYVSVNEGKEKDGYTLKGRFDLSGDFLFKQAFADHVEYYKGKLIDNAMRGTHYKTNSSFEFTIEIKTLLYKYENINLCLNIGDDDINGIGSTKYGWATIQGSKSTEAFNVPIYFADGKEGKFEFDSAENCGQNLLFANLNDPAVQSFPVVAAPI